MGLIKITADMTDAERTAVLNSNLQYLQLSNRLRKYPIGMIVVFYTDIDPKELYGGTWERIKGAFIWGIDDGETAGTTGGEKAHTLTVNEIPAHAHTENGAVMVWNTKIGNVGADPARKEMASAALVSPALNTGSTGGGQSHNNMPPYYGAYIWRKTAHGIGEDPTLTEYEAMMKQMNDALSETKTLCNLLFSNALRGSASGEAVRLTDVSPLEHTLTVKLKSKNLLPFPYFHSSMLQAGITYTVNSDGTITANGTATGRSEFVLSANKSDWASGNYVLSGCPSGGSADTYSLQTINGFSDTGSGLQKNDTAEFARISIIIKKGTTVSNLVFKPQLELGTTPTAYTPYITDFSGVTLKRYGRNLVDISDGDSAASASTVDITESCPRGINIFGSAYLERSVNQPCRLRIDYVVDGETNYLFGEMMYSSGICTVEGTIPISATQVNLTFQKLINGEGDIYWKNIQLEIGDSATDYRAFQQQNYIANADGTVPGVTGISDDITLITDTDGVTVNAEYNKDINKVISELYALVNG